MIVMADMGVVLESAVIIMFAALVVVGVYYQAQREARR